MKEEKKTKIRELMQKLSEFSAQQREEIASKIGLMNPECHVLSPRNQMLIYFQAGDKPISVLAGFKQWQKYKRRVKKGERGYLIAVPSTTKNNDLPEDEEPETFFLWKYVFDISQTEKIVSQIQEGVAA